MKKYSIKSGEDIKVVFLSDVLASIKPGCEVFEVSENHDSEVYLGFISKETYLFIAAELCIYVFCRYYKNHRSSEKFYYYIEKCIPVIKDWVLDSSSIVNKEYLCEILEGFATLNSSSYYNDYFFGIDSLMDGLIYWCVDKGTLDVSILDDPGSYYCRDYVDFELCIGRSILDNLRYINGIFGIFPHLAEEEMVKRGQVAIDYLKSGKHLFRS